MSYTQNKTTLKLIKYLALTSFYWGVIITLFGFAGLITDTKSINTGNTIIGLVLIGVIPGFIGYYLYRHAVKHLKTLDTSAFDKQIITLAKRYRGKLSVSQVVIDTNLSHEKVKEILDSFVIKGIAEPEATEEGAVEYHFREFLRKSK